ncbi:MAG TPA: hypothetical protein PLR41_07600 [Alphaproteobacteria bacterium]|nr:hypothetical protein [Alphaproteobacteria bacterium]
MTEHDPFERELQAGLAAGRAPESLQRRVAQIPLEHLRPARKPAGGGWLGLLRGGWLSPSNASWTTGIAAAAASLAIGFWLGFAGLTVAGGNNDDELATLMFSDVPATLGEEL